MQAIICCRIPDISCCVPTKLSSMHATVKLPSSGYNRYHYSYLCRLSPAKIKCNACNQGLPKLEEMIKRDDEPLCFYPALKCDF